MINIKEINVLDLFSTNFLYINFKITDTSEDLGIYSFNLYKSNDADTDYQLLATDVKDFSFIDYSVNLYDRLINYYYKIEVVNKTTNEKSMSDIFGQYRNRQPDEIAQAIIFNYDTYLKNIIKNEMVLIKRKHNGQLCPLCYDSIRTRAANNRCPVCFGTKYVGGYYSPDTVNVDTMNTPGRSEEFTPNSNSEQMAPLQLWMSNFPVVQINDVFTDKNDDRYIVTSVQPTYKNYYLLKQVAVVQAIPKTDIVYNVPIALNNPLNIDRIKKDNNI